ncbi:pyridoxamine 5'-phosphate oxidase family protein [Crossiella sp. SN42]|nr:pyridoxamine 5'-phosphate oxidase family protein [Crossiella sp. SN42]MCO1580332.1 pyridoxamine 5'-phosphate oxidase family protein [Crossiella sp. SN42]
MLALLSAPPRPPELRAADVRELLRTERHLWLATANGRGPHLVPLAFTWDGTHVYATTKRRNRSIGNLAGDGRVRLAVGSTRDVVLLDATASVHPPGELPPECTAGLPLDPGRVPGAVVLRLTPHRIQAWRGLPEIPGRTVMAEGSWLC